MAFSLKAAKIKQKIPHPTKHTSPFPMNGVVSTQNSKPTAPWKCLEWGGDASLYSVHHLSYVPRDVESTYATLYPWFQIRHLVVTTKLHVKSCSRETPGSCGFQGRTPKILQSGYWLAAAGDVGRRGRWQDNKNRSSTKVSKWNEHRCRNDT